MRFVRLCLAMFVGAVAALLVDYAFSAEMKPMPNVAPAIAAPAFGRTPPGGPNTPLGEGLQKIDAPKFFFGVGLLVTLVGAAIKLAVIAAVAFVAVHYIRHRRGSHGEMKKDAVDSLIAASEDLIERVRGERDKKQAEAARLEKSLNRPKTGVSRVARKK